MESITAYPPTAKVRQTHKAILDTLEIPFDEDADETDAQFLDGLCAAAAEVKANINGSKPLPDWKDIRVKCPPNDLRNQSNRRIFA